MRRLLWLASAGLLMQGCSDVPSAVSPSAASISESAPFSLTLSTVIGTGANAGQVTVVAKVQNVRGAALPDVSVHFATDVGALSVSAATTTADGTASTTITSSGPATVTVVAGTLTSKTIVVVSPPPTAPPPSGPTQPPTQPGAPDPPAISLSPLSATVGVLTVLQANAQLHGVSAAGYSWAFGDGTTFQGLSPAASHTYLAAGVLTAGVTVTDALGRSASATGTVTVSPPPPPPPPSYTVTLSALPASVFIVGSSTLTATVIPENGATSPTSYAWDCDGDDVTDFTTAAPTNSQSCAYPSVGSVTSRVRVTGGSVTGTASTVVTVTAAALVVNVVPSLSVLAVGDPVTFTATVTSAGTVPTLLEWKWDDTNDGTIDFTDPSAPSPNVRITSYASTGPKTIKVTVKDTLTGRTVSGTATVTVSISGTSNGR